MTEGSSGNILFTKYLHRTKLFHNTRLIVSAKRAASIKIIYIAYTAERQTDRKEKEL